MAPSPRPRHPRHRLVLVVAMLSLVVPLVASGCGLVFKPRPFAKVKDQPVAPDMRNAFPTTTLDPALAQAASTSTTAPPPVTTTIDPKTTVPPPPPPVTPEWARRASQIEKLSLTGQAALCRTAANVLRAGTLAANVGDTDRTHSVVLDDQQRAQLKAYLHTLGSEGSSLVQQLQAIDALGRNDALLTAFKEFEARVDTAPVNADLRQELQAFSYQHSAAVGQILDGVGRLCTGRLLEFAESDSKQG